ncbi:YaiI/YqxD family protein [Chengkuizengella sp. 2205SS18-9]|uniref:UPF0178 protein Q5Y73_03220 n=2 Tax=Chengkuizengella axinellae TaxID=3064388 RepID=A0ABT9IWE4_9BACL|nr:YaiI/YqxD family protein [Chengkuizengella sp. 2205SS18-9]MDP5273105.1 YaiI/YqxD family protein [Chengkuizengella sp. 2205SS18-9]
MIVDADACPVKSEIVLLGKQFQIQVVMVASFDHSLKNEDGVVNIQVDRSDQSADLYISNHISAGDILITHDFGLASICLGKSVKVISPRGKFYNEQSIDFLLENRHESAKKRRSGHFTKGPKPFSKEDRNNFLQTMTNFLKQLQDIE